MCDWFDNWDAEDFAFWGGFIETQIEGEKEGTEPADRSLTEKEVLEDSYDKKVFGDIDKDPGVDDNI